MSRSIRSILIANRGEIAMRIIATCKAMGIRTVTVYSEVDSQLPHALMSDSAYLLPGETLAETYLNQAALIEIAQQSGAEAIHPGYGFLSENAGFATKVAEAGLVFIGPPASCIATMGDKIAAREAAVKAGVPVVPGYDGDDQSEPRLKTEAENIGYPVMIKASAGGGGKGMRIVNDASAFADALAQAKSEALNAFGDDRVFLEKYITSPRHIEVQVFSDTHGSHVHLFERECSIQRRHQKIVEESPSPAVDEATRAHLTEAAVSLTQSIAYVGAGTVEYIMDQGGECYFLEMNTRLQVEHPVTEMITGLDLVRWQIMVAEGKPLPMVQGAIDQQGHAIEVRIYAENPAKGHIPSVGRIAHIGQPALRNMRLECGYADGTHVTMHYDPMLAKLVCWGETREEARQALLAALDDVPFAGVQTNRAYLQHILRHAAFIDGATYTHFLEQHEQELVATELTDVQCADALAAYLLAGKGTARREVANDQSTPALWDMDELAGFRNA